MHTELYFRSTKTSKEYKVMKLDLKNETIVLQGPTKQFEERYTLERFKAMGYELVQKPVADTPQ